ncbi:MAG TPA: LptF/LptG family permease [Phycisphaerae bacterium]|nr:LptF/LptG family permease [Phycisphaerae bacterium]HOJ75329.1 LptF/LptG family permease [Phycisphaerae bacterium]HOM52567.1 LptF/LptG family permease [Phycisphaerae bacterium]HON69115.1 LptF/LptG family permease [Phycisphaerae bacterium]HOQ87344.1 LptF/LptG family permease [Phycisphaerae bacterium]
MLKTLQWYITRELVKTFVLTALGLTLVFSLCGGVLNMIQAEVLTAVQVMRILTFVLPVATTLTLPVAALFACAVVYGRFAADNEFDACKASGINILRLFAPAMGLSVLTAAFTFAFANFVIPGFIGRLEAIVRADIQRVITQALTSRGYIKYGPYVLHAKHVEPYEKEERQTGQGTDGQEIRKVKGLHIRDAAFLMIEKDALVRVGTAEQVQVEFSLGQGGGAPVATAAMVDVVALDLTHNQLYQWPRQPFSPMELPSNIDQNPKWLNLADLFKYLHRPTEFSKVREDVAKTRLLIRECLVYRHAIAELRGPKKTLTLQDARRRYDIKAERAEHDLRDFSPDLRNVTVTERFEGNRQRVYKAERASLRVKRGYGEIPDSIHISLKDKVTFVDSLDKDKVNEPKQMELEDVAVPPALVEGEKAISDDDLLGLTAEERSNIRYETLVDRELKPLGLGDRVENARVSLLKGIVRLGLEIRAMIHSRLAFSAASLVMLVLAAALAIIFRGGQLLTAFAISFVPGLLVVVFNIMGRQMAEKAPTHVEGLVMIWAAIGLLLVADVVVLGRYLKR